MKKIYKTILTFLSVFVVIITLTACSSSDTNNKTINIVHKNYTEQRLIGTMLGLYLEDLGYDTDVTELGGTMLAFKSLEAGSADLYAEYTGSAYGAILNQTESLSRQETYDYVKTNLENDYGITWLESFGFNNTYVLSVSQSTADEYNLKTISDLTKVSGDLVLGSDAEFPNRVDGLPGLKEAYPELEFKDVKTMDQGLLYVALDSAEIQVIVAYATDGKLAKYNLVNLEDDLNFFPSYDCAPIMSIEFTENYPEIVTALNKLGGLYTEEEMQQYNLRVDEFESVDDVARSMLVDKGLIE